MAETCTTEEGWYALNDGYRIYSKTWKPIVLPKALLLFIHGFSDHINTNYDFFPILASHGIQTHGFDQRGWGKSVHTPAQKGLTGSTEMVLDDMTQFLRTVIPISTELGVPLFMLGHSMGGGQILQYAARGPPEVRAKIQGYLAEAPYIALHPSSQPSKFIEVTGKVVAKVVPKVHMVQKLDVKWISRDEQVGKDFLADKLCHETGTLGGLAGMLQRASELDSGTVMPSEGRFWIGHGDADHITSHEGSKKLFESLGVEDKEFKSYPGFYHKCHAELGEDKVLVANDMANWILARAGGDPKLVASKL